MNGGAVYPPDLETTTPITPEIRALWDDAWKRAKRRRFWDLLKLGSLVLAYPIGIFLGVSIHPAAGLLVWAVALATPTVLNYLMRHTFEYTASKDRTSARIEFKRVYRTFPEALKKSADEFRESASEDLEGCMRTVTIAFLHVVGFPLIALINLHTYIDRAIFISDYKQLMNSWAPQSKNQTRAVERGTNVLPSIELAGSSPGDEAEAPSAASSSIQDFLDGKLHLHSDGSVSLDGGIRFERHANVENVEINGLKLTRTDVGLLRVQCEGEDHAFFFNGTSWSEV